MSLRLAGILAPVVTTFRADGALDADGFTANVQAHLDAGLDGIVVSGSTGEAPLLDDAERARLVELARPAVERAEGLLIAGIGSESTRQCLTRARAAAECGAHAALCVAPHYYTSAMTRAALRAHFLKVADESPIPIVLYNIPKYAHLTLEPGLVRELSGHENIAGIKDSSTDLGLLGAYLESSAPDFAVLTGSGGQLREGLSLGARGGILGVALFAAPLTLAVVQAHARGAEDEARALQSRLTPLGREIVGAMGVAGVKAALDRVGLRGGPVRPPLLPLDEAAMFRVAELLEAAEVAHVG